MLIEMLAKKIGRGSFSIDKNLKKKELILFMLLKLKQYIYGLYYRTFVLSTEGSLFVGSRTRIGYGHKIRMGIGCYIGDGVKINALCTNGVSIGNNFTIHDNSNIDCTGIMSEIGDSLIIGNNVGISANCFIQVRGRVHIGNNVIFGPGVSLFSENHLTSNSGLLIREQGTRRVGVVIEDNVWVGANSTILDGVILKSGTVVAAGSVVNRSTDGNSIVAGVPAKHVKYRF